jgi:hypothetical protein
MPGGMVRVPLLCAPFAERAQAEQIADTEARMSPADTMKLWNPRASFRPELGTYGTDRRQMFNKSKPLAKWRT